MVFTQAGFSPSADENHLQCENLQNCLPLNLILSHIHYFHVLSETHRKYLLHAFSVIPNHIILYQFVVLSKRLFNLFCKTICRDIYRALSCFTYNIHYDVEYHFHFIYRTKWKRQTAVGLELLAEAGNYTAFQRMMQSSSYWSPYHQQTARILSSIDPYYFRPASTSLPSAQNPLLSRMFGLQPSLGNLPS